MNTKDTSGPAFPRPAFVGGGAATAGQVGMTLRDYFAAKAMQGYTSRTESDEWSFDEIAWAAHQQADAMLKARNQEGGHADITEHAAAPELITELKAAHQIIRNALNIMTLEQKLEWAARNEKDGVTGEGDTRANERESAIAKATGEPQ